MRTISRSRVVLPLLVLGLVSSLGAVPQSGNALQSLFQTYAAGDRQVIAREMKDEGAFDRVRRQIDAQLPRWSAARTPIQATFLLDLASVALGHRWKYWLDVVTTGRAFVMSRPTPIGEKPDEDAFELAWHKTAVALLEGCRRPDLVQTYLGILQTRLEATPSDRHLLVDPWIDLHLGMVIEAQATKANWTSRDDGARAIAWFDQAAGFPSARAEAAVRKAHVLLQMKDAAGAVSATDGLGDSGDASVDYWSRLFRARALHTVGRADEASRAYRDALALKPHAQSALVGLVALDLARNLRDEAAALAAEARTAPVTSDPWWEYDFGDYRFFRTRLSQLWNLSR